MSEVLLLVVIFSASWSWHIFKLNPLIFFILIIFNLLLLRITLKPAAGIVKLITVTLFLALLFYILQNGFDKSIWVMSPDQILKQNKRHIFYSADLRKLYTNKISLYYYTRLSEPLAGLQSNLFSNLDINLYFFSSHPRERAGKIEFEKYSFLVLPFFLIGTFSVIKKRYLSLKLYFLGALSMSAFVSSNYSLGPILFFPLINVVVTLGFLSVIKKRLL